MPIRRLGRISSLLPPLTTVVRWLQTGWYSTDTGTARRRDAHSAAARCAATNGSSRRGPPSCSALADLHPPPPPNWPAGCTPRHSLRELWHLRNALFTRVSIDHCESIAVARLAELNRFFEVRDHAPRPRRRFGTRTDGFDPHRPAP